MSRRDIIEVLRQPRAMPSRRSTKHMLAVAIVATVIAVAAFPYPPKPTPFSPENANAPSGGQAEFEDNR